MFRTLALVVVMLVANASAQDAPNGRQPLSPEDLYRLEGPQTVVVSTDGKQAAMIRRWVDANTRVERFSLLLVPGDAKLARLLEAGELDARAPVHSPDGRWIAVRSTRPHPAGFKPTPPAPPESDLIL